MLASHLGMPIEECMRKHTHRQYKAWIRYLTSHEINHPNRSDFYLMSIAKEIRACMTSDKPKIGDMKLDIKTETPRPKTLKEISAQLKNRWMSL